MNLLFTNFFFKYSPRPFFLKIENGTEDYIIVG